MNAPRRLDVLAVFLDIGFLLENSAVFQSQVGGQLIALAQMGYSVGVLAVSRDRAAFERNIGARLRAACVQIELVAAGRFPGEVWRMTRALRRLARDCGVRHAYVRGIWGALIIALSGGRVPYVYDVRGSLSDEMIASGTPAWRRRIYAGLERWGVRRARTVSAVSGPLASLVRTHYRRDAVTVVPCCVEASAISVPSAVAAARRSELGFTRECVLVYSGGLSHYQQVPAMLAIWRQLRAEPDVRFLLLTNEDPRKAPLTVGDLDDFGDRLRHLSLPHSLVAATLAAADLGFMLRDSRELNRVASPVKFAEYLGAGLAVVGSPHTGDASALIEALDVGTLVDPADIETGVVRVRALIARWRADRDDFRRRGPDVVRTCYDWRAHRATFQEHYGSPSGIPAELV